jgi:hypothetical protein
VQPPSVVEALGVVEHIGPGVVARRMATTVAALGLQAREEALRHRVVPAVAPPAHAESHQDKANMSSTYADSLRSAIESDDSESAVELLEPRVKEGTASESEKLLCGVLLLLPPLADYEAAARVFADMLTGIRAFDAAVWDAYRFSVLMPDGDRRFESILRDFRRSAVAAHMLSATAAASNDDEEALRQNRLSRQLRLFPFNIVEALRRDTEMAPATRDRLWRIATDLVISRSAESDATAHTVEGALQRQWDSLIVGTRLTTPLWTEYLRIFERT